MNRKCQSTIYNDYHKKHPLNIFKQNGTSERIHEKEIVFLNQQLENAVRSAEKKTGTINNHKNNDNYKATSKKRLSILNIPSGSGRLNDLLEQYYGQITCVDVCSQALINI